MQKTHGQYWRIGNNGRGCDAKIFLQWCYCKESQSFLIPFIAVELTIIYYSLLSFTLPSLFFFAYLIFGNIHWKLFLEIGKTKKKPLKVGHYKPATFVELCKSNS